jgi:NADH-quinone oxidoreductase subunit N
MVEKSGSRRTCAYAAVAAFFLAVLRLSLAGIPPLAGFAKFCVFLAAPEAKLGAAVIGVVWSVVGAFYYLRIVKVITWTSPREHSCRWRTSSVLFSGSGTVVILFVYPAPLLAAAQVAAKSLF